MAEYSFELSSSGYNSTGTWATIAKIASGSKKQKITAVTLQLGTLGNGVSMAPGTYNPGGAVVTGNGGTITTSIIIDNVQSKSVSVNNSVRRSGDDSKGYYPNTSDLANYTFEFDNLTLAANNTFTIKISTPATASGSTGKVLCIGKWGITYYEEDTKYTITFDSQGGSSVDPETATSGSPISMPNCHKSYTITYDANKGSVSSPSKSVSCTFKGWCKNADGSTQIYAVNESYTVTGNEKFYAIWKNPDAGELATPTRSQCKFAYWTKTLNGTDVISSSSDVTHSMTLYAKWDYYILYDGNGGVYGTGRSTNVQDSTPVNHGNSYVVKKYDFYIKPSDDDDEPSDIIQCYKQGSTSGTVRNFGDTISNVTDPITLYAQYNTKTFTVKFTDGWSDTILKTETVEYGKNATPPSAPEREGYTFRGWLGNYTNVKANSTVKAYWGFTPVWIYKSGKWVKYEPKEDK